MTHALSHLPGPHDPDSASGQGPEFQWLSPFNYLLLLVDQDGAEPSANSVSAHNLLRLHGFTGHKDWMDKCVHLLTAFSERMRRVPVALPEMVRALSAQQESLKQVGRWSICGLRLRAGGKLVMKQSVSGVPGLSPKLTFICVAVTCEVRGLHFVEWRCLCACVDVGDVRGDSL